MNPASPEADHLDLDAPPVAACNGCQRKTWAQGAAGETCGMTQPDGHRCQGTFVASEQPDPASAEHPERRRWTGAVEELTTMVRKLNAASDQERAIATFAQWFEKWREEVTPDDE